MKSPLRFLLLLDAAILILLGVLLIFAPAKIMQAFHFNEAPRNFDYLLGLWGCVLLTLAAGYTIASTDPWRHRAWIQIGIARGALEAIFGAVCIAQGVVTFAQGGMGTIAAAVICVAYIIFYPRDSNRS